MSGCLPISTFDGKPSKIYNNLIKVFGADEIGLEKASAYYEFLKTDALKKDLGFDWQTLEILYEDGSREQISADEAIKRKFINEQMEPNIVFNQGLAALFRTDGSKKWVEGDGLSDFTEGQIKELENYAIYHAMGKFAGLRSLDFEGQINIDLKGVFTPGSAFYNWAKEDLGFADIDFEELKIRVRENLRSKQLKMEDNDDHQQNNEDEGNEEGTETVDIRDSNNVVKLESFTINSKNTASANIKMLLSFMPDFESFTQNEDGTFSHELKEGEVTPFIFKDMDKIWRKLEDNISGIFTKEVGGEVESVLSQMMDVIYKLGQEDPSMMYVYSMLNGDRLDDYKKTQFTQAFLKQKLLFFTSDVEGKAGSIQYKFFDAGSETSKEKKLINFWEAGAFTSPYYTKDLDKDTIYYSVNTDKINKDIDQVNVIIDKLREASKNKIDTLTEIQRNTLNDLLNGLGIPTESLHTNTLDKVLRKVYQKSQGNKTYSEVIATGILLDSYIKPALVILSKVKDTEINSKSGDFKNPIKSNPITKIFAEEDAKLNEDFSESTLMGANNKMLWSFSLPTYLDITVHKFKTGFIQNEEGVWSNPYIDKLRALPFNTNSKWLEWLSQKENADKFRNITFNSLQKSGKNSKAVDNKEITFFDQLSDQMNKTLNGLKPGEKSVFYSPTPADKGRLISFIGPDIVSTSYRVNAKGNATISENSKSVAQLLGYFQDEYVRMQKAWNTVQSIQENGNPENTPLYVHYHLQKGKLVNEAGVPVGNAFKSQLFPELSAGYVNAGPSPTTIEIEAEKLRAMLYNKANKMQPNGINDKTEAALEKFIALVLNERLKALAKDLVKQGVFTFSGKQLKNNSIDSRIWDKYTKEAVNQADPIAKAYEAALRITGDYMINGMISNTEFNKVFSGDVAYFKDSIDFNKRVPGNYTDGKYLAGIDKKEDLTFKVAVIQPIEISARKLYRNEENPKGDSMEENFIFSLSERAKYMDEKIKPSEAEIQALALSLVAQYDQEKGGGVNVADAQGWITLERWKFLKTKLDGWSPKLDAAYERMKDGTFSYEDIKLAAQPLKGVYYNRDEMTGVPTYLKYSQMVLIPEMWKGSSLENLSEAMIRDGVDEVITLDGVKSGALNPTKIHTDNGGLMDLKDLKFNIYEMSNLHWKLQQQLPVKAMKTDMDLGSQIMKNVISNIIPQAVYGQMDGVDLTGSDVIKLVHETISQLTDIAFKEVTNMLGTDELGNIKYKNKLYKELAKQLKSKNMPSFIIDAIKRGYSLDAIPQVRYKAQNVISAMVNNNIAKTITPGASMIQMSNAGVTALDLKNIDPKTGIYMLKNVKSLKRPEIYTDKDGKSSVYSGQVFLPHSFIVNHIKNYRDLKPEQLFERLDKRLLNIIGYRIPNQKMSSIQPLEIVGILPASMGDAIMMYSEITTQTGSDFDIDKTYIMLPEFTVETNKATDEDSLKYVSSKPVGDKQGKKQLRNQLFELYQILLKSPLNYADMQSGIDGKYLKSLIEETHPKKQAAKKMTALKLVDPYYQLGIKFANSGGKTGVGLTANQLVDHPLTQIHDSVLIGQNMGIGNIRSGSQDFSAIYDTNGKVITDTISMFLNAFVDIAKDDYISDGNFNDVTSNIVFFMIRGGVPLDVVVKFIGQPSFEEVVKNKLETESLLYEGRTITTATAIENMIEKYSEKRIAMIKANPSLLARYNEIVETLGTYLKGFSNEQLQAYIDETNPDSFDFVVGQEILLGELARIEEMSNSLTELVLVSKADVNGGGPDIASHITSLSKFNKVMDEKKFTGLEERFAPNSMLGSKTQKTLEYLNRLDEQLFISANSGYKSVYTALSALRRGSEYILDKTFVQDMEKEVYSFAMGEILDLTGKYKITSQDLDNMFSSDKGKRSIADRVTRLKKQEDLKDNALIQNLEIKQIKGFKFVSLDNFKNKPSSSLDAIQRGWKQLFETPEYSAFAIDLVKYAFITSGFSRNRNSIYEVIPLSVSDDINRQVEHYKDTNSLDNFNPVSFQENLFRSPNGETWVPSLSESALNSIESKRSVSAISKLNPDIAQKVKELGLYSSAVIFVESDVFYGEEKKDNALAQVEGNSIVALKSTSIEGDTTVNLYKNEGKFILGEKTFTLLSKTHKLGLNEPGLKIFENGVDSDRSFIETNNPKKYDAIKEFVNFMHENATHIELSYTPIRTIHQTKNVIKPSMAAIETLTRRDIMEKKC